MGWAAVKGDLLMATGHGSALGEIIEKTSNKKRPFLICQENNLILYCLK